MLLLLDYFSPLSVLIQDIDKWKQTSIGRLSRTPKLVGRPAR